MIPVVRIRSAETTKREKGRSGIIKEPVRFITGSYSLRETAVVLPDELVDSFVELLDGLEIVFFDSVDDTGRHVFF